MTEKKPYIVIKPDGNTHEITRECALVIQRRNWHVTYGWRIEENPAASVPEVTPENHPVQVQPASEQTLTAEVKETKRPRRSKATDVDPVDVEVQSIEQTTNEGDVQ